MCRKTEKINGKLCMKVSSRLLPSNVNIFHFDKWIFDMGKNVAQDGAVLTVARSCDRSFCACERMFATQLNFQLLWHLNLFHSTLTQNPFISVMWRNGARHESCATIKASRFIDSFILLSQTHIVCFGLKTRRVNRSTNRPYLPHRSFVDIYKRESSAG